MRKLFSKRGYLIAKGKDILIESNNNHSYAVAF